VKQVVGQGREGTIGDEEEGSDLKEARGQEFAVVVGAWRRTTICGGF
jgi:hypothetical protein